MRSVKFAIDERLVRTFVFVVLGLWGGLAYVRGLFNEEHPPGLTGVGLAVTLLNVVTFVLLAGGVYVGRGEESRWRGTGLLLLLAALASALALHAVAPHSNGGVIFSMVALWVLLSRLPLRWSIVLSVLTVLVVGMLGAARTGGPDYGVLIAYAGISLGAMAGRQGRMAQEATRQAEAANAVLAERSRIAREIHDILAHSLSAQMVHLEGARLLLSRDGDRVQVLDRVERAQRLARSGLEETRRALATLRGEALAPEEALAELAEEFHASTGRPCEVEVVGIPRELSPKAGLAVVRTAQEALTNVRKHAPGAHVRIALRYLIGEVELEVVDTGGTEPPLVPQGGGYGLVGMRERAALIDGTLETGPEGEGFRVSLKVPG